jgi:pilus assembly protein Flp/PilA
VSYVSNAAPATRADTTRYVQYNWPRGDTERLDYGSRVDRIPGRASVGKDNSAMHRRNQEIHMLSIFRQLMKNEQGATAIEYVLIASLISVAAIVAMGKVGGKVSNVLSNVAGAMT